MDGDSVSADDLDERGPNPAQMTALIDILVSREAGDMLRVRGGYVVVSAVSAGGKVGTQVEIWQVPTDDQTSRDDPFLTSDHAYGTAALIAMAGCGRKAARLLKVSQKKAFDAAKQFCQKLGQ